MNEKDTLQNSRNLQADSSINTIDPTHLITPGERIGKIELGSPAEGLEKIMGRPARSDAAMGKAWITWYLGKDDHNNSREVDVFTSYKDNDMDQKIVRMIRTSSNEYRTLEDISVYASLEQINKAYPGTDSIATFDHKDGRRIGLYENKTKGIGFEIVNANDQKICIAIIIFEAGTSMKEIYSTGNLQLMRDRFTWQQSFVLNTFLLFGFPAFYFFHQPTAIFL